jgi:hypothetical protein
MAGLEFRDGAAASMGWIAMSASPSYCWMLPADSWLPCKPIPMDVRSWERKPIGCLARSLSAKMRGRDWSYSFTNRVSIPLTVAPPQALAEDQPELKAGVSQRVRQWQATLPDGPKTEQPGLLAYPGYHEAPGRGPLLDRSRYEKLLAPVRVRLMRAFPPADNTGNQTK